ncbi:HAMP domain-containing protein, partial [Telmatospirillum siberiense]
MVSFRDIRIVNKVLLLLGLLGLVAMLATVFATGKMRTIDNTYGELVNKTAHGTLALSRAATRLRTTGMQLYDLIAEEDAARMKAIVAEMDTTHDQWKSMSAAAKESLPDHAADIGRLMDQYETLFATIRDIQVVALANDNAKALAITRERFAPAMDAIFTVMSRLLVEADQKMRTESASASAVTGSTITLTYGAVMSGLVLVMILAVVVANRAVSKPIVEVAQVMERLSDRDYSVQINGTDRRDEVGIMAKAVQVFKDNMMRADQLAAEQEKDRQAREQRAARLETLTRQFETTVGDVLQAVSSSATELQATASSMSATAEQTTRQATTVAAAAEQASANVQTVASASEELSSSIGEIGRQVAESTRVATEAREQGNR